MPGQDAITRLNAALEGRYRIERQLGEGGMATVYLADDLRHERKVALKVLKPELAAVVGAERFLAEIKTTAKLQHPHVLPLFDSGEADSFLFYVMPYVDGESLRHRLDREHQLPVDEAVQIAKNVAEALDYAHSHGVIHRDIKPANILIQAGKPVVSDFGIALAIGAAGGGRLTETGLSLGTPHYMSPEQATGDLSVGPATDIYALGCVLYEMLAGDPPFTASTPQAILGKIVTGDPEPVTRHRRSVPPNVNGTILKALERVPADRFGSAAQFGRALADERFRYGEARTAGAGQGNAQWRGAAIAFAALFVISLAGLGWSSLRPVPARPLVRVANPFEDGQGPVGQMYYAEGSPSLLYVGPGPAGVGTQLWIRRWAELEAEPVEGTEGVISFAASPDGTEVAFVSGFPAPLRVVSLEGGPARTLLEQAFTVSDWTTDGTVYFGAVGPAVLGRIPARAAGGESEVERLTEFGEGETIHALMRLLPGERIGVFQVWHRTSGEDAEIWAIDLATRERWFLTAGNTPRYSFTGHLLFGTAEGSLMAVPIDPETAEFRGTPQALLSGLTVDPQFGLVRYAVSEDGSLIYRTSAEGGRTTELVWVTRSGATTPVVPGWRFDPGGEASGWALSPDGGSVAFTSSVGGNVDVWVRALPDSSPVRLTFDDQDERYPAWVPTGDSVTYLRDSAEGFDAWQSATDGAGAPQLILDDGRSLRRVAWSPEGSLVAFVVDSPDGTSDIVAFRPGTDASATPLVATPGIEESHPAISPDGAWLAYTSLASGRREVYVTRLGDLDYAPVLVSTNGGSEPEWSGNGSQLFYINSTEFSLVAAEVDTTGGFRVVRRETLFQIGVQFLTGPQRDIYDVSPDGERFLFGSSTMASTDRYVLVQNFSEELNRLAPID